ncbi:MAG: cohesin domain-containing protein [Candidatus Bathyarchaeia archaeon]
MKTADVNDDAIVNIIDVTIVATAYGSYPGHPKWNPLADLNNDQVLNIIDVNHVASHFGKWYPTGSSKTTQNSALSEEGIINLSIITRKNNMFSVDVNIAGVTDLYGYEFKIYYGRAALNCVDINMPKKHFLEPINDPNNIYIVKMEFDNAYNATHGRIWIAVTLLGNEPGKTGKGTLVTITFAGKAKINPIISIQDIILVKAENPSIET